MELCAANPQQEILSLTENCTYFSKGDPAVATKIKSASLIWVGTQRCPCTTSSSNPAQAELDKRHQHWKWLFLQKQSQQEHGLSRSVSNYWGWEPGKKWVSHFEDIKELPLIFLSLAQLLKQSTDSAGIKRQELCGFPRLVNGVPLQYFGNTFYTI